MSQPVSQPVQYPVWDLLVRVFHWSLVTLVILNYFVLEEGETLHQWAGYSASAWVGVRLVWGFVGSKYARFSSFWPTRQKLKEEVAELIQVNIQPKLGHTALGATMMIVLCALVLGLGSTGYMMGTDLFFGEEWLEELHEGLANSLISLAVLHGMAAWIMGRLEQTNLIRAMWTGVKEFRHPVKSGQNEV